MSAIQSANRDFGVIQELLRRTLKIKQLDPLEFPRDERNDGSREYGASDNWDVATIIRAGQLRVIYKDGMFWGAQKGAEEPQYLADLFDHIKAQSPSTALAEGAL
ncbi:MULTISPECIES: hypothetical protein [Arthrobacter]|uniref:Uncharacterized protein n=1 Tax=Arthrobacter terricola TaxID=2547396 RepID=A0A4V2ZS46_9MICC|nr:MULTISPECIES: hypothetical protein [Arthrobacter]MBT8163020.1 hypothetical protein [Arthrobacter sp. GN70]TDF91774.1 hypothetical protein E1809_19850 [Arthrobacter terricola]